MTAHPIAENGHCWWLVAGKERRLHAIRGHDLPAETMRAAIDDVRPVPARAVCGLRRRWWMPGLYSRLGRRRCMPCCRALVFPPGYGTPVNENDLQKDQAA
jgi:hypothetical protein